MKNLDNIAIKVTYDGEGKEIVNYLESLGYNRGHLTGNGIIGSYYLTINYNIERTDIISSNKKILTLDDLKREHSKSEKKHHKFPKWMMVWDEIGNVYRKFVIAECDKGFITIYKNPLATDKELEQTYYKNRILDTTIYAYAEDLPSHKLPIIANHIGLFNKSSKIIRYGCVTISLKDVKEILNILAYDQIEGIVIHSQTIDYNTVEQVVEYCEMELKQN
jgi:hypothetical protein